MTFYGWSDSKITYVAVFATYVLTGEYLKIVLAGGLLLEEGALSALQYKLFSEETLEVYDMNLSIVV